MPKCHLQRPVYDIPHYKQNHPVLKQRKGWLRCRYFVHFLPFLSIMVFFFFNNIPAYFNRYDSQCTSVRCTAWCSLCKWRCLSAAAPQSLTEADKASAVCEYQTKKWTTKLKGGDLTQPPSAHVVELCTEEECGQNVDDWENDPENHVPFTEHLQASSTLISRISEYQNLLATGVKTV